MDGLNVIYGVHPSWKLRVRYIPHFGKYLEGYSVEKDKWVVLKALRSGDFSGDRQYVNYLQVIREEVKRRLDDPQNGIDYPYWH